MNIYYTSPIRHWELFLLQMFLENFITPRLRNMKFMTVELQIRYERNGSKPICSICVENFLNKRNSAISSIWHTDFRIGVGA